MMFWVLFQIIGCQSRLVLMIAGGVRRDPDWLGCVETIMPFGGREGAVNRLMPRIEAERFGVGHFDEVDGVARRTA